MIISKTAGGTVTIRTARHESTADALYDLAIAARKEFLLHTRIAAAARASGTTSRMVAIERDSLRDALEADRQMSRWERHAKKFRSYERR